MRRIGRFWRDKRASTGAVLLLCLMVILLALSVVMEVGHAFAVGENVRADLSRAVNTSVALAIRDEYRREHLSVMDEAVAQSSFDDYLKTEMELRGGTSRVQNGKTAYRIAIESRSVSADPARMEIRGTIFVPLLFFKELVRQEIEIPFSIASRNQRLE